MDICRGHSNCVGFVFGGDANCGIAHWSPAMDEVKSWKNTFSNLTYVQGIQQKPGDFMAAASEKGRGDFIVYKNTCRVQGREQAHDPMVFKFSWTRGARFQARVEEPANGGEPASGATEHIAASAPATVHIPVVDSWTESNMRQIAADLLVAENLEQDQISEADYDRQSEHDADEPDAAEDAPDAAEDAPDAAELRARLKEAKLEEPFNELECLDAAWMKPMFGTCAQKEKDELSRCMELFLYQTAVASEHVASERRSNPSKDLGSVN